MKNISSNTFSLDLHKHIFSCSFYFILGFVFSLFISNQLSAIQYDPGPANFLLQDTRNGQNIYYHSNTLDLVFSGSQKWGVSFILKQLIKSETIIADTFIVHGINTCFENDISFANIYLHEITVRTVYNTITRENEYFPIFPLGRIIASKTNISIPSGNTYIEFDHPIESTNTMLIIEFPPFGVTNTVYASLGEGNASYYWESYNSTTGILKNFNAVGYKAELLFSLVGTFKKPFKMIDILSFTASEENCGPGIFYPNFQIMNNSVSALTDVFVKIRVAQDSLLFVDSLFVTSSMSIGEVLTAGDIPSFQGVELPNEEFSQYLITLEPGCNTIVEPLLAQTRSIEFDYFPFEKKTLIELFANSYDQSAREFIDYLLSNHLEGNDLLFFFPSAVDPYYTIGAWQRNRQYNNQSMNNIFINGHLKQNSFSIDLFNNLMVLGKQNTTFITSHHQTPLLVSDSLKVELTFQNHETDILKQNLGNNSRYLLYIGFVQKFNYYQTEMYLLSQIIENNPQNYSIKTLELPKNQIDSFTFFIPLRDLKLYQSNQYNDLYLYTWIQDRINKKIYHQELIPLSEIDFKTHMSYEQEDDTRIVMFPNPLPSKSLLNISFIGTKEPKNISLSIYNIKGQQIHTQKVKDQIINLKEVNIISSGIYFMKIDWTEKNKPKSKTKKLLIIN